MTMITVKKTTFDAGDGRPKRDLKTRAGRSHAVMDTVMHEQCTLPPPARYVVAFVAHLLYMEQPTDSASLVATLDVSRRTLRKYLAILAEHVGEDAVPFIGAVIDGKRTMADWVEALRRHGGLR